ncbi:MAG: vWA domain-containing protein [Parvibaculaceae bacterium]
MLLLNKVGLARFSAFLGRWTRDKRGSYAVIFAISLVPILIAIGGAIDLSQAYIVKQRLTRALDAAGLAVGGVTGQSTAQIQALAQNFFNANYPASKIGTPATLTVTPVGNVVTLSVSATMPTSILGVIGVNTLNIGARSQITRMGKKLEVMLVLDTTGSMSSSNKLSTVKTAAANLIDTVSAAALNLGDVKVGIVPFTMVVNVGSANSNATWLKWTYAPTTAACTTSNRGVTTCSTSASATAPKSGWSGCVIDRDQSYDISVASPSTSNAATLYPADGDNFASGDSNIYSSSCATKTLSPLSTDFTALKSSITNLTAGGGTNTTIGLVWGWQMLTQSALLSNAAAPAANLDKVIVFLTDGDNTFNRQKVGSCNGSDDCADADNRTAAVCTAMKTAGIIVYTIRVMDGNDTLLKNCATDTGKYYSVTSASQLTSVFQSIAQALSNLRVSQ